MGSFCSVPMPFRMSQEEQSEGNEKRGQVSLIRQLSYDIYKIEGAKDSRDDFEENWLARRPSKRYYEVSKSTINRIHPQLPKGSTVSSFRSSSSARMASFSDWTRTQQPSSTSTELALEQLRTETSRPSSCASASSSDSSDFESNQSDQSASVDLALERTLDEQLDSSER